MKSPTLTPNTVIKSNFTKENINDANEDCPYSDRTQEKFKNFNRMRPKDGQRRRHCRVMDLVKRP